MQHCMYLARCDTLQAYVAKLKDEPDLLEVLMSKLLINVTSFFRDPECGTARRTLPSSMPLSPRLSSRLSLHTPLHA